MFIDDTSIVNGTRVGDAATGEIMNLSTTVVFDGITRIVGDCTRVGDGAVGV